MNNQVILITGAASGIGKATAIEFASQNITVVIADISEKGEETRDLIIRSGGTAMYFKADVSSYLDHKSIMNQIIHTYGRLDYVFNNAGIEQKPMRLIDVEEENWDRIININLKSVWLGMKAQIPYMRKQGRGVIINTASVAALKAVEDIGIYNASKAGVVMLSKTAAREYARDNIRVNAICPGLVMTEMAVRMSKEHPKYFQEKMLDVIPMSRGGQPQEIAKMVLWLCREATFITGQCITADGGWLA
ncbi:SDR family NAD(P)-dependent oxidoreductase (plasmid) [Legionella sp. D16C41]|uniref:SDR family NAD(P)-dependent oxidoreductase n=1 Tax=Legionella sp. D16C41 TaxID=3402688 RepID=UPI003AF673B0